MGETMDWILTVWKNYWGEGYYQYLLLAAAGYLLLMKNKKQEQKREIRYLTGYLLLLLAVFFCPVTADIIFRCVGKDVYWRVLWALPVAPAVAYAGAALIRKRKQPAVRVILLAAAAVVIAAAGKSLWRADNYQKVHNHQQVPDVVAQIANIIAADRGDRESLIVTDDYIASYLRVYDPSMLLLYGRRSQGVRNARGKQLYLEMGAPQLNYETIAALSKKAKCAYVAVPVRGEGAEEAFGKYGYQRLGTANEYWVFLQPEIRDEFG